MSFIYGKWTKEEFEEKQRSNSVFAPFQQGPNWYRIKELSVSFLEVKFQAEEVEAPVLESKPILESKPAPTALESQPEVKVIYKAPPHIRHWAKTKGLIGRGRGPSKLPLEILNAYKEEFGEQALLDVLARESLDSRREYGLQPDSQLYTKDADKEFSKKLSETRNRLRESRRSS